MAKRKTRDIHQRKTYHWKLISCLSGFVYNGCYLFVLRSLVNFIYSKMSKKSCPSRLTSKCEVNGCNSVKIKNIPDSTGLTLHQFPKKKENQEKWCEILDRKDLLEKSSQYLSKFKFICSLHFEKTCYTRLGHLRPNSFPSIFNDISPVHQG